jgi:hypothetical protein
VRGAHVWNDLFNLKGCEGGGLTRSGTKGEGFAVEVGT